MTESALHLRSNDRNSAFPLVGHQGRVLEDSLTTSLSSFSKLSKGYDKSCGTHIRSIAYPSGSSADGDIILKPKRLLKQQKRRKEGHDRRRSHHLFLVSASKDTGYNNAEDIKISQVDMGLATMVAKRELTNSVNDMETLREALFSVEARAKAAERAKTEALEALARAEAKQHEYALILAKTSEAAIEEIRSAKLSFNKEIDRILEENLKAKSEKMIAKQDAFNLVARVEEVAEVAIMKVAARIVEEVKLKSVVAETSASVATARVEGRIRNAAVEAANAMISETRDAIQESFAALEAAKGRAREAEAALALRTQTLDDLVAEEASALGLQQDMSDLRQKLEAAMIEMERRTAEVKSMEARAKAAEVRAAAADAALLEVQESANRRVQEHEESARKALETLKEAGATHLEAAREAFKADVEVLEAAARTVNKAEEAQEQAYKRRYRALERLLTATEASAVAWQDRASAVEDLLLRVREQSAEADEIVGKVDDALIGGRMESFLRDDSRRWDLLANGPRCEAPEWMARRIDLAVQGLPPRKATLEEIEATEEVEEGILELPSPNDVWCIASAKVIEDTFLKQAAEKAIIDEQRKALERTLEWTTPRRLHKGGEDGAKKLESGTGSGLEIVFQGFNWESWRRQWYLELASKAADLSKCGITTIWFPPPTESVAPQGYMPSDLYNLNSAYGTVEELKLCIEEMHKHDLLVLGDAVLNHRCAQRQNSNGVWNVFGGKLAWGPEAIVKDDPNFQGQGNLSSGDIFHAAPNIDHSQDFVQKDVKEWLQWLRTEIGFDGWRLDFVRGFWGGYVKEYVESSQPAFAIGEYWDSLAYEGGTICYNQDAHRQRIINWINATGGTSSAFDVTTKGILHAALHNQYWRLIDPQGKPPGVIGWWPSRAVTFLENHDTGSTQGHWPFPRDKLMQGYAYILTHPGTPVVFYDHFYDFGLHDEIAELIKIRNTSGVHCRSVIQIHQASNEGYAAQIGENLVVKLGYMDWNPSKQMNLVGNWNKCIDKGADYQIWVKS